MNPRCESCGRSMVSWFIRIDGVRKKVGFICRKCVGYVK
jgi:tRNA(Ile2) C34 agmatinyltransferase TiaS